MNKVKKHWRNFTGRRLSLIGAVALTASYLSLNNLFEAQPFVQLAHAAKSESTQIRLESAIAKAKFKAGELGVWVGLNESKSTQTVYRLNDEAAMIPASLSKLATLGAALKTLQPGYKFQTQLAADAKLENGVLRGPIYLVGGGDPSFVSENMWFLVNELTRAGVSEIAGDIVVDDSRFDQIRFGDDRQEERVDRAYDAPVGAMSFNWNSVNVYFRPGEKVGAPLKVFADVASSYIKVKNTTRTVESGKGKNLNVERVRQSNAIGDLVIAGGTMAIDQPEVVIYKNISQPDIWAGYGLAEFVAQRGIKFSGVVRAGLKPKTARALATSESKPLSQIVADMAKWSNNYVAEMLVKALAAESGEQPATMATGLVQVRKFLQNIGFKQDQFIFENAAGFTRKNRFSAKQLGLLLEHVRQDFSFFPEYLAALPIAGVDGTLRKRMLESPARRWVRAKTGLLNGVVGLAGYAGRSDGTVLTFTFLYNGAGREDRARALFDELAEILVSENP